MTMTTPIDDTLGPAVNSAPWLALRTGWAVLPLMPDSKRPYGNCVICKSFPAPGCPQCDKGACVGSWCHGVYGATTDAERAGARWPSGALVGVAAGTSGLAVLDVEADGMEWLAAMVAADVVTPTLALRSASGRGLHLYYSGPVPTRQHPRDKATGQRYAFDVKSTGGYVRWTGDVVGNRPVAPWPESLTGWLQANTGPKVPTEDPTGSGRRFELNGSGTCRHTEAFRTKGVEMAMEHIGQHAEHGAGSALYGRVVAWAKAHRDCPGGGTAADCGGVEALAAMEATAVSLGVPIGYAARQVERALTRGQSA